MSGNIMIMEDFDNISYKKHENHYDQYLSDDKKRRFLESWSQSNTVDAYRHKRMYDTILALLKAYQNNKWLTVGDGRYGTDAHYLEQHGQRVLATDISDTLLKKAYNNDFIKKFKKENAENLSFKDNEFDFCLCKESYHHFPRPIIALYEMLRVSKKAIVLIEPRDYSTSNRKKGLSSLHHALSPHILYKLFENLFSLKMKAAFRELQTAYRNKDNLNLFEEVGNYVYLLNEREIEKIAFGLGLTDIAFLGINDYYLPGVEFEEATEDSKLLQLVKKEIKKQNNLCKWGFKVYGLLIAILFKEKPQLSAIHNLKRSGFYFPLLP